MARKKITTRKYKPKNEFRYSTSNVTGYHPHYIFGETQSGKYKSFGLTTSPSPNYRYLKLTSNPNPDDNRTSYMRFKPFTLSSEYYSDETLPWEFSRVDRSIVRHRIKEYKRRLIKSLKIGTRIRKNGTKKINEPFVSAISLNCPSSL